MCDYLGVVGNAVANGAEVVERGEDAGLGGVRQEKRDDAGESRERKQSGRRPRHLLAPALAPSVNDKVACTVLPPGKASSASVPPLLLRHGSNI